MCVLEASYHLFNAQIKESESLDEGFLCGDSSERQAATALAASELDMATSDKCPSWRLNKLQVKQKQQLTLFVPAKKRGKKLTVLQLLKETPWNYETSSQLNDASMMRLHNQPLFRKGAGLKRMPEIQSTARWNV